MKPEKEKTGIIDLVAQLSSTMQMSAQAYNAIFEAYTVLYAKKIETETELAVAKTT